MASGLPYFKFSVAEWLTGDIVYESFESQGLFINICATYWQRNGQLTLSDINKRYKKPTALPSLIDKFFSVIDDKISIDFLDSQLLERIETSSKNSQNGKLGGRPKILKTKYKNNKKPTANPPLTQIKANGIVSESQEEENREEENREEYLKESLKNSLIEQWIIDLPNSSDLEDISRINKLDKKYLISRIPDFTKRVEMSYPTYHKFLTHFRNWVLANPVASENTVAPPSFKPPRNV